MSARFVSMMMLGSAAVLPAGMAMAQATAVQAPTVQPVAPATTTADPLAPRPQAAAPAQPPGVAAPQAVPLPPPPPPIWQPADAQDLLAAVRQVGSEGLDPRDYDPAALEAALRGADPMLLSRVATDTFNKLSRDFALGHVRGSARQQWFVVDKDLDDIRQRQLLDQALASHSVGQTLRGLLPTHPQYGSLRVALQQAQPGDTATINKIRLNMDRWRWLPRDLGERYIIVNVPGIHATLVENGVTRWKHRAIAGATKTPTPQLSVHATGVILNPWWEVPKSLSGEVAGKRGYVAVKGKDGKVQRWRQPPGPSNALGKIKFVMPNSHAIYLHDTNNRGLFDAKARFLSHGCIRTEHILDLAGELLSDDGGEWNQAKIDEVLASGKTVEAKFVKPVPVYIVYFSAAALTDGKIVTYQDLYKRDAPVIAALNDRDGKAPTRTAAK
ncbi:L,D-transpeptidase family protein [Sphingomonas sp. GCM10030256]|uniref:L,D-transpeptidase family protein n=1 Tax=Sphingomonas sp. GCM10030256 TaxID=3273427 RepID=UPI00361FC798